MIPEFTIDIQSATPDDIDAIVDIENTCFAEGIREVRQTHLDRIVTFSDGFLVVKNKDQVIGYISSEIWSTHNSAITDDHFKLDHNIKRTHTVNGSILYISSMAILPNFRRAGLGYRILNSLITKVTKNYPSLSTVSLIVGETWLTARKLYDSVGFQQVRIVKGFFKDNDKADNGLIMYKDLYTL